MNDSVRAPLLCVPVVAIDTAVALNALLSLTG